MLANTQNLEGISKFSFKKLASCFYKFTKFSRFWPPIRKSRSLARGKTLVVADRGLSTGGSKGFGDSGNDRDVYECVCRGDGKGV